MNPAYWLNTLWMAKCAGEARLFAGMTRRVAAAQAQLLTSILHRNRETEFGRRYAFGRLSGPRDFQDRVPLTTYDDYAGAIERIAAGAANVLTRDRVLLLEPTSGSTGGEKLIPYTATLRRQFQRAVAAWIADLLQRRPAVRAGRAYWSISPAFGGPRRTAAGIPIGFDDDTAYLGTMERWLAQRLLAAPAALARLSDIEAFRYGTLLHLLRAGDLALVSIWNPSFLGAILAPLFAWGERLCDDLRQGRFTPPGRCSLPAGLRRIKPAPARANLLASLLRQGGSPAETFAQLWPRLALISCWGDASAAPYLSDLRALFPRVEIQPKGLLATEGVVSFPLVDRPGAALAVGSHFFEFAEAESQGARCRLAHELARSGRYRVVLTTGGGLYRYQLQDEVEVVGFENQCPLLRFLGKADRTCDLVGEKLSEPFVRAALTRAFAASGWRPRFALLVPVLGRPPCYRLYLQGGAGAGHPLSRSVQEELEGNPYFRHAVALGQLGPVEVQELDSQAEPAERVVERHFVGRGQKAGAIKPAVLDSWTGWPELFRDLSPAPSDRTHSERQPIPAGSRQ
jgi:hypothetical protein